LLVALASAIAVFHQIGFSAWFDETYTYGIATQPFQDLIGKWAWGSESNMILYYLVIKAWLGATGLLGLAPNEVVLRIPGALAAIGASVMVYLLGRRLFGPVAGLVGAGLYLANFLQIIVAQMARSYSLELLLVTVSWYALVAALQEPPTPTLPRKGGGRFPKWWALFVASSALAVYAALFSGLVLASQAVALALLLILPGPWRQRIRAGLRPAVLSFAAVGVLITPIAVDAALHGGPSWVAPVNIHTLLGFFRFIGGGSRRYEFLVFAAAALGGLLALLAVIPGAGRLRWVTRARPEAFGAALAMAVWFAMPIAISFALTQPGLNLHLFFNRYLVVVIPPLCLLAGLAVGALRWRIAQAVLAVGLAAVAWPQLLQYYPYAQAQDIRGPVQWIEQRYQAGDGLICDPSVECGIPIEYYLEVDRGPAHFDPDSPGRFFWAESRVVSVDSETVGNYATKHRRIFFIFAPLGVLPPKVAEAQQLESTLGSSHRAIDRTTAHAVIDTTVVLYER
jgi:4-amino-4-deoxy-L-arabinose transferase-like glycosyltransferase